MGCNPSWLDVVQSLTMTLQINYRRLVQRGSSIQNFERSTRTHVSRHMSGWNAVVVFPVFLLPLICVQVEVPVWNKQQKLIFPSRKGREGLFLIFIVTLTFFFAAKFLLIEKKERKYSTSFCVHYMPTMKKNLIFTLLSPHLLSSWAYLA